MDDVPSGVTDAQFIAGCRALDPVPASHPRARQYQADGLRHIAEQLLDFTIPLAREHGAGGDEAREHLHRAAAELIIQERRLRAVAASQATLRQEG